MNPLSLLTGAAGPYIAGAVGIAFLALAGTAEVQTLRLHHAKDDLSAARSALVDPITKKTWESEEKRDGPDLKTCHESLTASLDTQDRQSASILAAKADGDRRAKALADGLVLARKGRASAEERAGRLLKVGPVGIDACARSEAARLAVLESLR